MFISHSTRYIFVHVQKTGGISIDATLRRHESERSDAWREHQGRQHMFASEVRALVQPQQWETYYKFAFVRNPWGRLVSWYHMCMQAAEPNAFARHVQESAPTFDAFIRHTTTGLALRTTYNQLDYVADDDGKLLVDFVGRYERLRDDFEVVRERLGITHDLPHANRSSHSDYRDYYTDETRAIVAQRFARDIAHFDYSF
ncbi:MAG: sulfotransferase family 2 domain-containing protein [Casimicrobiaceae bacterium]